MDQAWLSIARIPITILSAYFQDSNIEFSATGMSDTYVNSVPSGYALLSHSHTGSYDCLIVRSVAIWRTCDRSAMFATIASSDRILRSVFLPGGRSSYDWSYARARDQQRLEKIVRLVVAINDRSYDRSWPPTIDRMINSVGRRMGNDLNPRNISTFYCVSEQPIGVPPVAR